MPVTIGATENTFANPIGLLSDCHRRIERFLQALLQVTTDLQGGPLDAKHRGALESSLNYFRHAAPKHTADEEEDLFPALRKMEHSRVGSILAQLDQLEEQHGSATAWHREVEEIGERWLGQNQLSEQDALQLKTLLTQLSDLYRTHIAVEEQQIFPVAFQELSETAKQVFGRRMAARRGVAFIPEWAQLTSPPRLPEAG